REDTSAKILSARPPPDLPIILVPCATPATSPDISAARPPSPAAAPPGEFPPTPPRPAPARGCSSFGRPSTVRPGAAPDRATTFRNRREGIVSSASFPALQTNDLSTPHISRHRGCGRRGIGDARWFSSVKNPAAAPR